MFGDELKELTPKNLIFVINEKLTKFYINKLTEIKESLNKNFIFPMNIFFIDNSENLLVVSEKKAQILFKKNEILGKINKVNNTILQNSILIFEYKEPKINLLIHRIIYQLMNTKILLSKTINEKKENSFIINSFGELKTFLELACYNQNSFFNQKDNFKPWEPTHNIKNLQDIIEETILEHNSVELASLANSVKKIENKYFN